MMKTIGKGLTITQSVVFKDDAKNLWKNSNARLPMVVLADVCAGNCDFLGRSVHSFYLP